MTKTIPILLFHDIESDDCPNEKSGSATKDTVVNVSRFKAQMAYLAENGFKTITLGQLFSFYENNEQIDPKTIIITFDDGHYSNYKLAFPILLEFGFKAVFFIVSDRIDAAYHLTGTQIKEMIAGGMEVGSHGLTHQYLPLLDQVSVEKELFESKKILKQVTGQEINFFCFPGGHYTKNILEAVKKAGYKGACSCHFGVNTSATHPYLLKRIEIRKKCSIRDFKKILVSSRFQLFYVMDHLKWVFKKIIGLNNYSKIRSRFYKYYIFKK